MNNKLPPADHTLPPPHHELELPAPHDMLLREPHFAEKHPWVHWLPAIFGLFVGLIVGNVFFEDRNVPQPVNSVAEQKIAPLPVDTTTPTLTWKTYKNEAYSFSIQYPSTMTAEFTTGQNNSGTLYIYNTTEAVAEKCGTTHISINFNHEGDCATLAFKGLTTKVINTPITINGVNTIRYDDYISSNGLPVETRIKTFYKNNTSINATYIIIPEDYNNIETLRAYYDYILSTLTISRDISNSLIPTQLPVGGTSGFLCTADAKICPDGSSVSRSGPSCEFAACPVN